MGSCRARSRPWSRSCRTRRHNAPIRPRGSRTSGLSAARRSASPCRAVATIEFAAADFRKVPAGSEMTRTPGGVGFETTAGKDDALGENVLRLAIHSHDDADHARIGADEVAYPRLVANLHAGF